MTQRTSSRWISAFSSLIASHSQTLSGTSFGRCHCSCARPGLAVLVSHVSLPFPLAHGLGDRPATKQNAFCRGDSKSQQTGGRSPHPAAWGLRHYCSLPASLLPGGGTCEGRSWGQQTSGGSGPKQTPLWGTQPRAQEAKDPAVTAAQRELGRTGSGMSAL